MAAVKKPEKGLVFPVDEKGERSTSVAGRNVIAAAIAGGQTPSAAKFSALCAKEKNWRFKYQKHFMNMVQVSAESPQAALGVASAGIDYMHKNFEFIESTDSAPVKFSDYMANAVSKGSFFTGVINGTGAKGGKPFSINYKNRDLTGESLKAQVTKWANYGTIEPDAAATMSKLADGNVDLQGQHFVLIGAGSAMGPFYKLLEHGATVVCVDIPGTFGPRSVDMWKRIFNAARNSPGTILFPLLKEVPAGTSDDELIKLVGCNLMEQPAQILNWLAGIAPGKSLTIGNYTYLDGDLHVKLSLAADAIIMHMRQRRNNDVSIAFLCTPTDIHAIPDAAYRAAKENYGFHPGRILEALINVLSMGKFLRKNALPPVKASGIKLVDGLSVAQGPNYALAKRLQHWRAMVEYEAGAVVSTNIAPSTATLSVVSNRSFGWAYGGMPYFKPYEIFQQETTNGVMAALLISDVAVHRNESAKNPKNRDKFGVKNTLELFKLNSVHGGVWRCAYQVDSIGETSVIIHFLGGPKRFLFVVGFIFAAVLFAIFKFTNVISLFR